MGNAWCREQMADWVSLNDSGRSAQGLLRESSDSEANIAASMHSVSTSAAHHRTRYSTTNLPESR